MVGSIFGSAEICRSPKNSLDTIGHINFFIDITDVGFDRIAADKQFRGDILIGKASDDQV